MNCGPDLNNRRTQILAAERLILHFHGVGPVPDGIGSEERNYWCEEDRFKSILDSVCTLSTEIPIEITFDDGNISDAVVALPALVDRGLTASFFVCAGRIGLSGYLDKSAMIDIISSNMDIGSHGWGHVDWRRVDDKMLDVEFDEALKKIADTLGCAIAKVSNRIRELRSSSRASIVTQRGKDGLHERWGPRFANRMDAASRVFQNLVG